MGRRRACVGELIKNELIYNLAQHYILPRQNIWRHVLFENLSACARNNFTLMNMETT